MEKTMTMFKKMTLGLALLAAGPVVLSQDLFVNGKLRPINPGSLITIQDGIARWIKFKSPQQILFI